MKRREEQDSLGTVWVPAEAYYGAQTQRAVENFPVSGMPFPKECVAALALVKRAAAATNRELGILDDSIAAAIVAAAEEVSAGKWQDQFVVDVFQTGSGTSSNMNMNEVLAGRANELLTGRRGGKSPVHPNDHVNLSQSSNDVIPSVIHIASLELLEKGLLPALYGLQTALAEKSAAFAAIGKIGRTHMQDAVPMTLGEEFSGYAQQVVLGMERLQGVKARLAELALGGTAVGNGLNADPRFAPRAIALIAAASGLPFVETRNHFQAQACMDTAVELSGLLKTLAVGLIKIAEDLRLLASGPRCGLGEISLPSLQPGSSIMPGKINPVIPEVVLQVAVQVMGNDAAITAGGAMGRLELNTMLPLIAHNLIGSLRLLTSVTPLLTGKCVGGIVANRVACEGSIEKSLALVTGLVPLLGYDQAAAIARQASDTGGTVREVLRSRHLLEEREIDRVLGPERSSGIRAIG